MEGRALIKKVEETDWFIVSKVAEGDEVGEWTYTGDRGESIINYLLADTKS